MLNPFSAFFFASLHHSAFALNPIAIAFAHSADYSLTSAATAPQIAQRRIQGSISLHLRHFSGHSRASRQSKMSIQRITPSNPRVISAEMMQFMQQLRIKSENISALAFS